MPRVWAVVQNGIFALTHLSGICGTYRKSEKENYIGCACGSGICRRNSLPVFINPYYHGDSAKLSLFLLKNNGSYQNNCRIIRTNIYFLPTSRVEPPSRRHLASRLVINIPSVVSISSTLS